MANVVSPVDQATPAAGWPTRSGWSGKIFALGGLIGLVAAALPLVSVSMEMMGLMRGNQTSIVFDDWRGKASLLGYLAALAFALVMYPPGWRPAKPLVWAGPGVGLILVLLGISLAYDTFRSRGGADILGMANASVTPGVGSIVNLVAAAMVAVAGMIKAREERLF